MRAGPFPLIFCLVAVAMAQTPTGPTVIRTETRLVLVDAVVTDRSGAAVKGLTAQDFHLWDDGKEQTIQSVTFVGDSAAQQPSYLVFFFDNSSLDLAAQGRARDAAVRFIDANAGPNRYMSIVNYTGTLSIAQNFTTDAERLKRVAADEHIGADVQLTPLRQTGQLNGGSASQNGSVGTGFALGLRRLASNLSEVAGRKSVVVFSEGYPPSSQMDAQMKNAIAQCNRHDVALYPVVFQPASADSSFNQKLTKGRAPHLVDNDSDMDSAPANQSLNSLATGTGGFLYSNTNSLLAGLVRIGRDQTDYYLLGYSPAESREGACHPLKVKVDRAGVNLRARSAYCNVKAVDLLAGEPVEQELEYRITGDQPGTIAASMQAPFFYVGPGKARLNVTLEIPSNAIHFQKVKGKSHADVNIVGIAYLPDGTAAGRFSDSVALDFATQAQLDAFRTQPLHYEKEFLVFPASYKLKVAFSSGGDGFGKLEVPVAIDAYDGQQFMVSSLVVSKEARPASDLGTAEDAELMEGHTPLIYKDVKVVPTGAPRFAKTDSVVVYGEVYEPLAGATPPVVEVRMQVVDKQTGTQQSKGVMRPEIAGTIMLPFALKVKVDNLPPGAYRVDVEAVDSAGKIMARSLGFEMK